MKKKIIGWALVGSLAVSPVFATQQEITQIGTISGTNQLQLQKAAVNERLANIQSNFSEMWDLLEGNPWIAQTTTPNIHNVFWIDTSAATPTIKYWDGDSWEVAASGGDGTYTLPAATALTLGGVKDGSGVTITADGTLSADAQLVGDCTVGPCLDGTSDGGNYIKLWAGTGSYWTALQGGSPAANRSWRLPIAAPPAAGTTYLMNMDEYGQMGFAPAVSDAAYGVGWNGDTGSASKNAIYDKIETIAGGSMTYPGAGIPVSTSTAWGTSLAVAATIGETGSDTNIPTEQAVREALTALPIIAFGTGLTVATDTPSAGTDTISVTANTYQAYDADLTTWAGVTPGTGIATALAVNTDTVGGLSTIIAKGSYTVDTASIAANTCASAVAVTATGVATTDIIISNPNATLSTVAGFGVTTAGAVRVDVYPTSGNVNFQFCNPTSAAIDPGSVTFNWRVLR